MSALIPRRMFFTRGAGFHRNKLQSFELALRDAGIEKVNLVMVSSILPPDCKIVPRNEGLTLLQPGEITYSVLARESTNEPNRRISAAIGVARPKDRNQYGYISEHHGFGEHTRQARDFSEDLAATMLASTLGIELDPEKAWDERKQIYVAGEHRRFVSQSIAKSVTGHPEGLWTTVIAAAIMLLD